MDRQAWASALVQRFRAPTVAGVNAVAAWATAEGGAGPQWGVAGNLAAYNPLNNTLQMPGSVDTPGNVPPVQAYTSWAQGLDATEQVIRQPNMAPIRAALEVGADCRTLSAAVAAAPWGTGSFAGLCPPDVVPETTRQEVEPVGAVLTQDDKGRAMVLIYAIGAGPRAGQLLEFRRYPGDPTANDVRDVTAGILPGQPAGDPPYTVSAGA